jgi:hypothetical protein
MAVEKVIAGHQLSKNPTMQELSLSIVRMLQ